MLTAEALRNILLEAMATQLNGGELRIFDDSGPIPTNAQDATGSAVQVCTVTVDDTGVGITFEADAVAGVIQKKTTETWQGTYVGGGPHNLSFYRWTLQADDNSADPSAPRLQGTIGLINADMNVSQMTRASGEIQQIDSFVVGQAASGD